MATIADTSEVGVANEALSACQVRSTIAALNQANSKAARVVRLHFAETRDAILRSYAFAFASEIATVPALPGVMAGGAFTTAFAWPQNALRILGVDGLDKRAWRVAGDRRILCNAAGSIVVRFVERKTDFAVWDPLARALFVNALAIKICPELTHHAGIRQRLAEEFARLEAQAQKIDAFEQDSQQDDGDHDAYVPEYIRVRA